MTQGLWRAVTGSNPSSTREMYWEGETHGSCASAGSVSLVGDSFPVMCVDWCDAVGFANALSGKDGLHPAYSGVDRCASSSGSSVTWDRSADGYRLLTESEWEVAARGGERGVYAGAASASGLCGVGNVRDRSALTLGLKDGADCDDGVAGLAAVGRYAANGYGLHDMTGNVWEWAWDRYGDYPSGSARDPVGPQSGAYRVYRGGSWGYTPQFARVAYRYRNSPDYRYLNLGVRLARTIP